MAKRFHRLFEQFKPESYDITIHPDSTSRTFTGTVKIVGQKAGRPSRRITLHQKDLKISSASITRHEKKEDRQIAIARTNLHNKYNEARLHTDESLYSGRYTIVLEFSGKITDSMQGIYLCAFQHKGLQKYLIATQFESNHAREVFPGIDEPEAKAVFRLTLVTAPGEVVLSNTPVLKQTDSNNTTITAFEATPRMSTYLLAFVIGEMHSVQKSTKDGILVQSWAVVSQYKSQLRYSLNEAVKLLEFYTDYFGVDYPLKKCDQVALPDFDAGAMENWGLITYREITLLVDPKNRSISSEQYVSMVIAHELSHQWFGNLVTMRWWDDLWLNESFASFMEHLALDVVHPKWNQWELYTASDVIATTSRDIYSNIQPVGVPVNDPDILETIFDPGIVYAKGARLIKMLRDYIGDQAFTKGLKLYFERYPYNNASRSDLWQALTDASGKDIAQLMTPWLVQAGMPMVSADQKGKKLKLSQRRFLLDDKQDSSLWPIPLLAREILKPDIFKTKKLEIDLASSQCVILNQQASSHYITYYSQPEHRRYIAQMLQSLAVPTESRINILNDMLLLSRHGDMKLTSVLDIIQLCNKEPRDSVWTLIARTMATASQLTEGNKVAESYLNTLRANMARYWYEKLGWQEHENDDTNTKQLRHSAIAIMVGSEFPDIIAEAKRQYKLSKAYKDINAELRPTILGVMVRYGGKKIAQQLMDDYTAAAVDLQLDITSALSRIKDPVLAKYILKAALGDKGFVRPQDMMRWLALFLRNHYIRSVAWQYMEENWKRLEIILSKSKSFDYLPIICSGFISTEEWARKYKDFFTPKLKIKVLHQNIQVGFSDIKARVAWRNREESGLIAWLEKYNSELH